MDVIYVNGLTVKSRDGGLILDNVSFSVSEKDFIVVAGPSGGGKSTLLYILAGGSYYLRDLVIEGSVEVCGFNVLSIKPVKLAGIVGFVSQDPYSQVFNFTVEEEIAFPLENMGLPRSTIKERIEWVVREFGLDGVRDRLVTELSMGQLQKVVLASVIAMKPRILLLDEPASYLDPLSKQEFYRLVYRVWRKMGLTIVVVEHDLSYVLPVATKLLILNKRVIVYDKPENVIAHTSLEEYGVEEPLFLKFCKSLKSTRIPLSSNDLIGCLKDYVCKEKKT